MSKKVKAYLLMAPVLGVFAVALGAFAWFTWPAVLFMLLVVGLCLMFGAGVEMLTHD